MAIRKSQSANTRQQSQTSQQRGQAKKRMRNMLLETLEQRQLLTVAPQLIGIQPNNSDLLADGDVRNQAPRELVFRFDDQQVIDESTLDGIRITRAGGDGTFGVASSESDFGSGGHANLQLTATVPGESFIVSVATAALGAGNPPLVGLSGNAVSITLNESPGSLSTAGELISAINTSPALGGRLVANLNGGLSTAELGVQPIVSPIVLDGSNDQVLTPGAVLIGDAPNENEVTFRFAETLIDDQYRIEVFGYDDPNTGVVGLRNVSDVAGEPGMLFEPSVEGTRKDTVEFRLDLGPQVVSVVPQPVIRDGGVLTQQRDTVVVYFDADKLLVENDSAGNPTSRSVENPNFYQLIFTSDTVRNTDDIVFMPTDVTYNAAANTATLKFAGDINDLAGSNLGPATYRLRIGTRESVPAAPTRSEAAATVITDLNTNGAVTLKMTAREVGESGSGITVNFINTNSGTPVVTVAGRAVTVDMGRPDLTAAELVDVLRNSSAAADLFSVDYEPGSDPTTVVGSTNLSFSPVELVGLGSSFSTAMDLGVIGSGDEQLTSLILSSAIDPESFVLDLPGASDDPGHRQLPQSNSQAFEDHVNKRFGADATDGITTIYYNFRASYALDQNGTPLANSIDAEQRERAREVLSLWSDSIGVQFVETEDLGLTIALGTLGTVNTVDDTQFIGGATGNFTVRVDPTFDNSLVVMSASEDWDTEYGQNFTRVMAAAVGMTLGLEHAGDLPETTLLRLDPTFLSGTPPLIDANDNPLTASDEQYEPIFPGAQDVIHGNYLHRKDSTDIDLFRFEVDFGDDDRVGLFTAETYAQRLPNSSPLNTHLELFREVQASATSSLGAGNGLSVNFEAVQPGAEGNSLQVFFTQTERGNGSLPTLTVFPNAISIDLNSTPGAESTAQDIINAINASPAASSLVSVSLAEGDALTKVGGNLLTQNPVILSGGRVELVSQNDDYFSSDSIIKQSLSTGVYYVGVSASGNDTYNGAVEGTGFGGDSQGEYELRVNFRAAVDTADAIQDIASDGSSAVALDGDGDGIEGGTHNFWFQTRPLNRSLSFNAGANAALEGQTLTLTGANGTSRTFEFSSDPFVSPGRIRVGYAPTATAGDLANALAAAIVSRPELGVGATANGIRIALVGEQSIDLGATLRHIDVAGRTIFVDKSAGPNADGSLANPFNNISAFGVPNAFGAAHPGDIVRIVGNGGVDGSLATTDDNFAYEIGAGLLAGSTLEDGSTMDIPQGVTTMIDAGAIFKLRRARIGVGSTNLNIDRSGGVLQVLGAPVLVDAAGNALRTPDGVEASGNVYFTSWLDESLGLDNYAPSTTPTPGDWGGISYRRDVDIQAGRRDLEHEGIFLQHVSHADIRWGGGTVIVDAVQQTVNPIQMLNTRPTITDNIIRGSSNAAMSALPNSFEETNFQEPRFQADGAFTSDYDRVGPEIRRNTLLGNSVNGLFIRVDTPADGSTQTLTVPGRIDDIDIVHLLTENVEVTGVAGGSLLDSTTPPVGLVSAQANVGGTLAPGLYNYKMTFVDRNGYESVPSDPTNTLEILAGQDAVDLAGLPAASGDYVARRLYRSNAGGTGPYTLIATLDRATSTYFDNGTTLGGTLGRDRTDVGGVILVPGNTEALPTGSYSYRIVNVDAGGREGLASNSTQTVTLTEDGDVTLRNLPPTLPGYVGRRIYRSSNGGTSPYVLIADLPNSTSSGLTVHVDDGSDLGTQLSAESLGVQRPRLGASLVIDPGAVIKLESARIEATFGANIIAEGTDGAPIVFTSRMDDTVGAGGTFDTNNNGDGNQPSPRDWGGIYLAPTSRLSIDHARIAYAGGVTKLEGTFRAFNTIEIHQADARIANTLFENNADGFGGQGPGTRFGRLSNAQSTIFVRGSQPTLLNNEFRNNIGSPIEIDVNSLVDDLNPDTGRQTGTADRDDTLITNRGPLIRGNRFDNNTLNGLEIRAGDILTTASVWDDTDIVHVVTEEIFVGNVQHEGGLRLQSAPKESLVVKFDGYGSNFNDNLGAGLTSYGELFAGTDRIGGTLQVVGQPGFPVILTSLFDDTVGAGQRPDGSAQTDTNNDGIGSIPQAGDWRGLFFDQYSNDRNVALVLETEDFQAAAPGPNGTPLSSQVLGDLAADGSGSSENRQLGYVVEGVLSQAADVDVYSFSAEAGTEIWLDVDHTANNLDLVLEVLDANGQVLARSDNSTDEANNPGLLYVAPGVAAGSVNPLTVHDSIARRTAAGEVKDDGTTNPLDPGMRIRLPGNPGSRTSFYFRVRSAGTNIDDVSAGLTSGAYQVQVRLREAQEWAGSTVNFADIRYAMNGVHTIGLPSESPLIGEAQEDESVRDGAIYANNGVATGNGRSPVFSFFDTVDRQVGVRPQYLGNILETAKGGFSVAGEISTSTDLDFYMIEVRQEDIVAGLGGLASVVFDIDYADGLNRPDTSLNIFRQEPSNNFGFENQYRLVYTSNSSNIAGDQAKPLSGSDLSDLSRGSVGTQDAYIGPVALEPGTYLVGVSSDAYQPRTRVIYPSRVEPINSLRRIVDSGFRQGVTTAEPPVVQDFVPRDVNDDMTIDGEVVTETFDLGNYVTEDLANIYLDYDFSGTIGGIAPDAFEIFVRDAAGDETLVATTAVNPNVATLLEGTNFVKIPLSGVSYDFAGQDGLSLVFRSETATTEIDNIIIGFAERGETTEVGDEPQLLAFAFLGQNDVEATRTISLATYDAFLDAPALEFGYDINDGTLDVFVVSPFGATRVATSDAANAGPNEVVLIADDNPYDALVDISPWAGLDNVTIEFRTRDQNPTNVIVTNAFISLADGGRIFTGEPNPTYVRVASDSINTGKYQLEVRLAETFFESEQFGPATLTKSFDTNDRFGERVAIVAPAGADITDGDTFSISDGGTEVLFEFTSDGVFGQGRVPVSFAATDPAHVIAKAIRDSINGGSVQSRLEIQAASSGGLASGTAGTDERINLFGNALVQTVSAANAAGEVQVELGVGHSDSNITRQQSQFIVQNSFIRESRDYGVWSEPAARLFDPRDFDDSFLRDFTYEIQDKPNLVGTQAVRNLPTVNDDVEGGLLPGLVVQNNVLEEGGLGGVMIQGENPIWMLTPQLIPATDNDPTQNNSNPVTQFGFYLDDGDLLVVDTDRTRVQFEFEDLAGGATGGPVFGSGTVEGDGYAESSSVAWYRDTGGAFYDRLNPPGFTAFATTALETVHALRDSILGSILVTNGTTQTITATVAESLLGADPNAPATEEGQGYPLYFNRPALYLEGPTNIQYLNSIGGGNPFDTRQLDLGETPQPHARIINNTIIGRDGRASFNGDSPIDESNDTIGDAVQTWQGTAQNPLFYSDVGVIGDGGQVTASGTTNEFQLPNVSPGGGSTGGGGGTPAFNADRLIIGFTPDMSAQARSQLLDTQGLTVLREFSSIDAVLVSTRSGADLEQSVDRIGQIAGISYVEPDYLLEYNAVPNDPRFDQQWHYDNQGQTGGTVDADIDLPEAWENFTGSEDVVIAVIDSGVDYTHPDLAPNMWRNPGEIAGDGIDNDGNGYIDDIFGIDPGSGDSDPQDFIGHGTHVAGTTSAAGNNGTGVSGVNWNAKIMALKIGTDFGGPSTAAAIEALDYIVNMKTTFGVNVVVSNNSYGGGGFSQAMFDAIERSNDAGVVFVAAAGNSGTDNDVVANYPSGYDLDGIISVAATDHNDQLAGFSQFGATTVDIAAPGVDILSTTVGGGYGLNSGTSMASPHVAGVVGLLAGANPAANVAELKAAVLLGADPLAQLSGDVVTGARLNAAKSLTVIGAGLAGPLSTTDVDIYQFKLNVGERAIVDIDTAGSGLDSVLQIFDARGVAQEFVNSNGVRTTISDNDAAPGETVELDPYADFTALQPGVYYAAVSSVGNENYDPLSFANRTAGTTTGAYRISISARHLQDFVITAQHASAYQAGDTFTIHGVPDVDSTGSSGRTFEFVFGQGGPTNPNNIPINLNPDWLYPDVAVAIARAVNEGGTNRGPAITNEQSLPNGNFADQNPLPPVYARALGGVSGVLHADFNELDGDREFLLESIGAVDGRGFNQVPDRELERILSGSFYEVNQGLELFARRFDGFVVTTTTGTPDGAYTNIHSLSNLGIGHDVARTQALSHTSRGDGTTEKFVVINNAAWIEGNGSVIVDPEAGANNNLDQLLPETGVLASRGASPTVLNNVFFNLQTPVINEESRVNENTGIVEPYGTDNPNVATKPGEVILGGSVYQYHEPAVANLRFGTGIETGPTNIPNTGLDLNFEIDAGVMLFENAQAGQYLPAAGSPLIDSSVDTLPERTSLAAVKTAVGIPLSPAVAPDYDLVGQLRADDPAVSPPGGQGQNIFKDRGAFDRADFIGPAAFLIDPLDNDAFGVDEDNAESIVELSSGIYPEFRIQLRDGNEPSNPLRGIGIDDNTVVNAAIEGVRPTGASVVIFENGRMLEEGVDYTFSYNETKDEIVLTPLAGVWRNGKVYEITVNNKDRFVITAPSGDEVADGEVFTITDENGGVSYFEYDSGFRLQVPQGLEINVPLAGGAFGGITDGDRFYLSVNGTQTTFEFDSNDNILAGNLRVPFTLGDSQAAIANAVVAAIDAAGLPVTTTVSGQGSIFVGAEAGVFINTEFSSLSQPATTWAFEIPEAGPRGAILDGHSFTISDGRNTVTFEYDTDGSVQPGRTAIDFTSAVTADDVAGLLQDAIVASPLNLQPTIVGGRWVHLGLSPRGTADLGTSLMELVGVARTLQDGESFTISTGGVTETFELTRDADVGPGNIAIDFSITDNQTVIADRIVAAIEATDLDLRPKSVGGGNIALGGQAGDSVNVSSAPGLSLRGTPGVRSATQLRVFGPLILQAPVQGAGSLVDGSQFSISANGITQVFEFDGDNSGPTTPTNIVVPFTPLSTGMDIATSIVQAVNSSSLGILASNIGNAQVSLGQIDNTQVNLGDSGMSTFRGVVSDGEIFTISDGSTIVTFEFDNVDLGNGFQGGNTPIRFSDATTPDELVSAMEAAIEGAGLGLTAEPLPNGILQLNDTPQYATDVSQAPTLVRSGVPGGATPINFIQDVSFTGLDMKLAIIEAINNSGNSVLSASDRGGSTFFVSGATTISDSIDSFFLRGVADLAGNLLKPNRINNETQFTILMPGVTLDYGDAPDPVQSTPGRYPTKHANDGARHVVGDVALLGSGITADVDGQPAPGANSDEFDDGLQFGASATATFNPHVETPFDITLSSTGFVDMWIDFNADGDWNDPGEHVIASAKFTEDTLTQSFQVSVPPTAPVPAVPTTTYARVRSSSTGGLLPTGLAVDGEVEDYEVTIVPGQPPVAVDDLYSFNEDTTLTTADVSGTLTPGFTIDDGVAANDTDPDGGPLFVELVEGPQNAVANSFTLNANGTFNYKPLPNFNGIDTFVYRVNDGVLGSNNLGTVTLDVRQVNDQPIATDDVLTINEDEVVDVQFSELTDNDAAGPANESDQTLTITNVQSISAAGGTVSLIGGRLVYTPPSDYSGPDSFVYTVTDNGTTAGVAAPLSASATVSLTVLDKNDAPTAGDDSLTTTEDTAATITTAQLLSNDSAGPNLPGQGGDESGQSLQFVGVEPASTNGGTVSVTGGVVTYTPAANFVGTDTFFYTVRDNGTSGGIADPQTTTGTVTVTVTGENDEPVVVNPLGDVSMQEDDPARVIDLSGTFADPDSNDPNSSESLTFVVISNSNPSLVTATIVGQELQLELMPDASGTALIVIEATDSSGLSVRDTLTLTVDDVNDPPRLEQAIPDQTATEDQTPAPTLQLSPTYFFDPDVASSGDVLTYEVVSNSDVLLVTPVIAGDTLTLELTPNRSGGSEITISATDSSGQTVTDTFILTVTPVDDAPETQDDEYSVPQGELLIVGSPAQGVLGNDSDPEGDDLTAVLVSGPSNSDAFQLNPDGTFTYDHRFSAGDDEDTFTYRASDGNGNSVVTTVTLTITEPPPPKHQNPSERLDVNADGFITPIDALLIINYLNGNGAGSVDGLPAPPPYRDVNGDNFIAPNDVLLVITHLNSISGGGGEGEASVDLAAMSGSLVTEEFATRSASRAIGVRQVELAEGEVYGPQPAASASEQVFDQIGGSVPAIDWVSEDEEEEHEMPFDLALASLLGESDENGDA
ncbi:MAG: hypothetical protein Aurels2KO_40940 [Aureliella sp.]